MNLPILATIIYGMLSGFGGVLGYIKSRSKPSLIAGCLSGIALFIAAGLQWQNYSIGSILSKIIILLLMVVFTNRLVNTGKFMTSGIMLIAGAIALSCLFS